MSGLFCCMGPQSENSSLDFLRLGVCHDSLGVVVVVVVVVVVASMPRCMTVHGTYHADTIPCGRYRIPIHDHFRAVPVRWFPAKPLAVYRVTGW